MYLMSAFEPPLCALVLLVRMKTYKFILFSVEFSSIGPQQYLSTFLITEYCQENVPIENVQMKKKKPLLIISLLKVIIFQCVSGECLCVEDFTVVIPCCNLEKRASANTRRHIVKNINGEIMRT